MNQTESRAEQELAPETLYTECATEYTLPDYLPDVRRILTVRCGLMPAGQYVAGEKAEFAGSCLFSVLYCDPEGKIASLSVPVDYHYSMGVGTAENGEAKFYEEARAENVSCRLMGPRKMQLRSVVASRMKSFLTLERPTLTDTEQDGLERLEKNQMTRFVYPFATEEQKMSVTMPLQGGGDVQLLYADGVVFVRELSEGRDGVSAKGEVRIEGICCGEDGVPFTVTTKAPFEEMLPEGTTAKSFCVGHVTGLEGNVSEEGENRQLLFDLGYTLSGHTRENQPHTSVADVFSTMYPLDVSYGEEILWRHVASTSRYFTLDGSVERNGTELGDAMTVAGTFLTTDGLSFSSEDNRLTAQTNAHVTMLLCGGMDEQGPHMQSYSFDYPVKMELALSDVPPADTQWEGILTVAPAHGRLDQNKLFFDCEVCLSAYGSQKETHRVAERVEIDEAHPFPKEGHQIIAAYLNDGDSLWSIAKRYHISPARIAAQNALSEEALESPDLPYTLDGYIRLLMTT